MDGGDSAPVWAFTGGPLRALGLRFSFRSTDAAVGLTLARLLGSLNDVTTDPAGAIYAIVECEEPPPGRLEVSVDGVAVGEATTAHGAVSLLLWDLNRRAVACTPEYLLLHAAAVMDAGRGIVLPGPSGAGKTTLAAALVRSGMAYLTDEVTAFDPVACELVPFPKPLAIERGSWAPLAALGLTDTRPADHGEPVWHLEPSGVRAGSVGTRCPPGVVIVHRFSPGSPTTLVPLRRSTALVALAESSFQPLHRRPGGLEALAGLVRRCECLDLTVGKLDDGCRAVLDRLGDGAEPAR